MKRGTSVIPVTLEESGPVAVTIDGSQPSAALVEEVVGATDVVEFVAVGCAAVLGRRSGDI